jgi:hypothetical protein
MRTALGSSLLLLALSGLVAVPTAADAATVCDAPDTTWVGPASADGDRSWTVASNWSNGVPGTTSAVCIPAGTNADPEVTAGTTVTVAAVDAPAAGLDVTGGSLTVTGPWDAARLHASGGEVVLAGASVLHVVSLAQAADLVVTGAATLAADADIDAFEAAPDGRVRVSSTGELALDVDADVRVSGLIVNHGVIRAEQGFLDLMSIGVQYTPADAASDGTYIGGSGADLWVSGTVLADGAVLDGVTAFDVHVPAAASVTATGGARLWPDVVDQDAPGITGSGTVVMTGDSQLASGFADNLTLQVPQGEQAYLDGWIGGNAHAVIEGTAVDRFGGLAVYDQATLDVESTGVVRMVHDDDFFGPERVGGPFSSFVVHPGGEVVGGGAQGSLVFGILENHGTVRAEGGDFWLLDSSASVVDQELVGGRWEVAAGADLAFTDMGMAMIDAIPANAADVVLEGAGSSVHGLDALATNELTGTVTLAQGATLSLTGPLTNHGGLRVGHSAVLDVAGDLHSDGNIWLEDGADVGLTGALLNDGIVQVDDATASISSAQKTQNVGSLLVGGDGHLDLDRTVHNTGLVRLVTGASLATTGALDNDGEVLATGPGAVLTPSGGTTNAARIDVDPDASLTLGGDLSSTGITWVHAGATLDTTGAVLNAGRLWVDATGRLAPAGTFTQTGTGLLRVGVGDTTVGRVAAGGVRDLAGKLVLRLETGAWPPLGSHRAPVTSAGRVT